MKKFIYTFGVAGALLISGSVFGQTGKLKSETKKEVAKSSTVKGSTIATPKTVPGVKQPEAKPAQTTIKFEKMSHDFGEIKQGDVVKYTFKFTNEGDNDLLLTEVKPTCGCTALDWPKEAIAPGKSGEIDCQFNSRGKRGKQYKYFTIRYNGTPEIERVAFTGMVIVPPPAAPKTPVQNKVVKEELKSTPKTTSVKTSK